MLIERGVAGGARHRRQPGRRLHAVDALRDVARLLRHGHDARRGAGRRDHQRRGRARSTDSSYGSLEAGKMLDAVVIDGPLSELVRVGAPVIHARDQARPHRGVGCGSNDREQVEPADLQLGSRRTPAPQQPQNPESRTMSFSSLSLHDFIQALASAEPTPGGGTAAAVAGAMGAALLMMVAGLPRTRGNTDEERVDAGGGARTARCRSPTRSRGVPIVTAEAFDAVMAAYRLPKASDEEKAAAEGGDRAVRCRAATEVPLETLRLAWSALESGETVAHTATPRRPATSAWARDCCWPRPTAPPPTCGSTWRAWPTWTSGLTRDAADGARLLHSRTRGAPSRVRAARRS